MFKKTLIGLAVLGTGIAQADVLTTIKPLGFIANAITDGVTETKVLLPTTASPHDYSLKPSDVTQLQSAQLVVWVGDGLESFLEKNIEKLPKEKVLTLEDVEAIEAIVEKNKKPESKKVHNHKHEHKHSHNHKENEHNHSHDEDWHIWLSSEAAELTAEQIAARLSEQLPEQKEKIADNLAKFKANLTAKKAEISKQLEPVKGKGYYTFHDAYGYFEKAYGLNSQGSFTINPTVTPGAKTLAAIKKNIAKNKAQCLFAEPQFTPKVIETLAKETKVNIGQLDPLGTNIPLSTTAYFEFLQALADDFSQCLAK